MPLKLHVPTLPRRKRSPTVSSTTTFVPPSASTSAPPASHTSPSGAPQIGGLPIDVASTEPGSSARSINSEWDDLGGASAFEDDSPLPPPSPSYAFRGRQLNAPYAHSDGGHSWSSPVSVAGSDAGDERGKGKRGLFTLGRSGTKSQVSLGTPSITLEGEPANNSATVTPPTKSPGGRRKWAGLLQRKGSTSASEALNAVIRDGPSPSKAGDPSKGKEKDKKGLWATAETVIGRRSLTLSREAEDASGRLANLQDGEAASSSSRGRERVGEEDEVSSQKEKTTTGRRFLPGRKPAPAPSSFSLQSFRAVSGVSEGPRAHSPSSNTLDLPPTTPSALASVLSPYFEPSPDPLRNATTSTTVFPPVVSHLPTGPASSISVAKFRQARAARSNTSLHSLGSLQGVDIPRPPYASAFNSGPSSRRSSFTSTSGAPGGSNWASNAPNTRRISPTGAKAADESDDEAEPLSAFSAALSGSQNRGSGAYDDDDDEPLFAPPMPAFLDDDAPVIGPPKREAANGSGGSPRPPLPHARTESSASSTTGGWGNLGLGMGLGLVQSVGAAIKRHGSTENLLSNQSSATAQPSLPPKPPPLPRHKTSPAMSNTSFAEQRRAPAQDSDDDDPGFGLAQPHPAYSGNSLQGSLPPGGIGTNARSTYHRPGSPAISSLAPTRASSPAQLLPQSNISNENAPTAQPSSKQAYDETTAPGAVTASATGTGRARRGSAADAFGSEDRIVKPKKRAGARTPATGGTPKVVAAPLPLSPSRAVSPFDVSSSMIGSTNASQPKAGQAASQVKSSSDVNIVQLTRQTSERSQSSEDDVPLARLTPKTPLSAGPNGSGYFAAVDAEPPIPDSADQVLKGETEIGSNVANFLPRHESQGLTTSPTSSLAPSPTTKSAHLPASPRTGGVNSRDESARPVQPQNRSLSALAVSASRAGDGMDGGGGSTASASVRQRSTSAGKGHSRSRTASSSASSIGPSDRRRPQPSHSSSMPYSASHERSASLASLATAPPLPQVPSPHAVAYVAAAERAARLSPSSSGSSGIGAGSSRLGVQAIDGNRTESPASSVLGPARKSSSRDRHPIVSKLSDAGSDSTNSFGGNLLAPAASVTGPYIPQYTQFRNAAHGNEAASASALGYGRDSQSSQASHLRPRASTESLNRSALAQDPVQHQFERMKARHRADVLAAARAANDFSSDQRLASGLSPSYLADDNDDEAEVLHGPDQQQSYASTPSMPMMLPWMPNPVTGMSPHMGASTIGGMGSFATGRTAHSSHGSISTLHAMHQPMPSMNFATMPAPIGVDQSLFDGLPPDQKLQLYYRAQQVMLMMSQAAAQAQQEAWERGSVGGHNEDAQQSLYGMSGPGDYQHWGLPAMSPPSMALPAMTPMVMTPYGYNMPMYMQPGAVHGSSMSSIGVGGSPGHGGWSTAASDIGGYTSSNRKRTKSSGSIAGMSMR